ncbi:hypothetical protein [Lentilactobacillus buchneri]|uniref:hypothetical protein n=1 Tax=Lentilactobacillus buchneri TaxID=1581 RepID=UPI001291ADDF|nr:hypothetical protein [Lentilactobacillus buchneri]MQM78850.1 hypothetical protein [Lentilactobacillus buchneri]MQM88841.1 hypothetical protein [Lentilactobacillus buchneri]MQN21053.1 hypothetical protein [Lentilactobacillus buchneri]
MKIRLADVFNNVNDIRQHMSIDMNDEVKQELAYVLGIGTFEIDQVLKTAQIYFDGNLMNRFVDVNPVE